MRSLRGRLALGVLVVLAAVLTAAGLSVAAYVDRSQRSALDDRLERTAELSRATAVAAVAEGLPHSDRRLDAVLSATGTSLRLLLGKVTLLQTGDRLPHPPGPARNGLRSFRSGGERYRSYVTTLRDPGLGGLAKLEVTASLSPLEHQEAALRRRLVLLGLAGLIAGLIGAVLAAELVLRPLRRLRAVASSIADDEDLDRRVPTADGPAEVRSLAASFNAMLARLGRSAATRERALSSTRRFAADAGHELRTPLTTVQAVLEIVRAHPELDPAQRDAMLDDAQAEQRRLVALIDGLQALARGDAQPPADAAVDLAELVEAVVADASLRHPAARLEAALPAGPVVIPGWEPGLRLMLENLVENAWRHGGEAVRVRVELRADPGEPVVLAVQDDGPGVPDGEGERERIFEPFTRGPDRATPGSGLGLALVAQQAHHHGAVVDVRTPAGGGARFEVRFSA